jgi:hypothetical protein
MPSVYAAMVASLKQENSYLFHLLYALEIAHKKSTLTSEEKEFFIEQFFSISDCNKWRDTEHQFLDREGKFFDLRYFEVKSQLIKVFPEFDDVLSVFEDSHGKTLKAKHGEKELSDIGERLNLIQ